MEAAQKVIEIQKELYRSIDALSQKGRIRTGVTSKWGLRMLSEIIPLFREQYPGVLIEITENNAPDLKDALNAGNLDVGLAADISTAAYGRLVQILREEEIFLAVSMFHPYAIAHAPGTPVSAESFRQNFSGDSFLLAKKAPPCGCWETSSLIPAASGPAPCARPTASLPPAAWSHRTPASPLSRNPVP